MITGAKVTRNLIVLLELAQMGVRSTPYKLTSKALASRLGISQQTAARWLVELEKRGLIWREPGPRGQGIKLTRAGLRVLHKLYHDLGAILAPSRILELVGRVTSGLGEGSYYVRQEGYRKQFKRELGFDPYPGTLDLKLDKASLERKEVLHELLGKHIEGFATSERTFGPVKCFPATLRGTEVAVVLPLRTHLTNMIEILAPKRLRKELKLKDGDEVKVKVIV